jgi:undecaprenyl-diphosphatase
MDSGERPNSDTGGFSDMRNRIRKYFIAAVCFLAAFVLWTAALCTLDRQPIGPQGSTVGLASMNRYFHSLTGVHWPLYTVTDWLSVVPIAFVAGFAALGAGQWIRRKQLLKVDRNIFVLGGFYAVVFAVYIFFQIAVINYRPVLIDGILEASYPSSTTMLVLCVMPTAAMQLFHRIKNGFLKRTVVYAIACYTAFMLICRTISGVHWFTDIVGGILLSTGLVMMYSFACIFYKQ